MSKMFRLLDEVRKDEEGATMVEYAILVGLISVVSIGVITTVGSDGEHGVPTACTSPQAVGGRAANTLSR